MSERAKFTTKKDLCRTTVLAIPVHKNTRARAWAMGETGATASAVRRNKCLTRSACDTRYERRAKNNGKTIREIFAHKRVVVIGYMENEVIGYMDNFATAPP